MAGSAAGADRQSRKSGGLHPKGPTQCRTRGCLGLLPAAAGLEGATPTPPVRVPEAKRRRALARRPQRLRASARAPQEPIKAAPSNPVGRRGGVRAGLGVSRRRALRPDRVCHAENRRCCGPWRLHSSPPEHAQSRSRSIAGAAGRMVRANPSSVSDRNPNGPRRAATRRRDSRRRGR